MKWKQLCSGILMGSLASLMGLPSQAHDTTAQLNQAICIEDWEGAIAILDNIIPDYPNSQNTLGEYRDRLQQLSETGLSGLHQLDYDCSEESTPKVEETPLSDRIESYSEQIDVGMSYAEVATIVGRPGKINDLHFSYIWKNEHDNFLFTRFSDDQLDSLDVSEWRDCEVDNPFCDNVIAPAVEFREIAARFEEGMNAQAVLEQLLQELGEPLLQTEWVRYEWRFREATDPDPNTCTLTVSFGDDRLSSNQADCIYDDR